jgi:His-Xaa-Ser system protein HxsD
MQNTPSTPAGPYAWSLGGESVALELDPTVYSVDAILKAAYKFTDRLYIYIGPVAETGHVRPVALISKTSIGALSPLVGEFMNELVDQQLRCRLETEFGSIRNLIVSEAFADGPGNPRDDDYVRDPDGAGRRR